MPFDSWITASLLESFWWTIGIFFVASLLEMWFPPVPGDAVYFIGLWTIAKNDTAVWAALGAAFCGGFAGFAGLYWLGSARGRRIFMRKPAGMWSEKTLTRIESWFQHWGVWVIVFGRFFAGVRSAVPLVAGVGSYPRARALVFGGISIVIWNGILAVGALLLGRNWEYVYGIFKTYNIAFWIIAGVALASWGAWRLLRRRGAKDSK